MPVVSRPARKGYRKQTLALDVQGSFVGGGRQTPACRGDVWTLEMKDRNMRELDLFAPSKGNLKKKICVGVVSHRRLQVEQPEEVAALIREALKYIAPEQLIVSSDCGFGRQGCNREIAFFKTASIAQGTNIVRRELGLPESPIRAADPLLQTDIVPKVPDR